MGFRFRRSIKLFGKTRLNIGKRGIGISTGIKGARFSVNSSGRKTTSLGLPGTGLSYIKTTGGGSKSKSKPSKSNIKASSGEKFYNTTWFLWLSLFIFAPLGIFLMWKKQRFNIILRSILSFVFGLAFVLLFTPGNPETVNPQEPPAVSHSESLEPEKPPENNLLIPDSSSVAEIEPETSEITQDSQSTPEQNSQSSTPEPVPPPRPQPPDAGSHSTTSQESSTETIPRTESEGDIELYAGEIATVEIIGTPNTQYFIAVRYSSGVSKAKGLESKTSDENGYVSWTWKVGAKTKPGKYSVTISGDKTITKTLIVK